MQCFNNSWTPNFYEYSHFVNEARTMTTSEYKSVVYHDDHYQDFSNERQLYQDACNDLTKLLANIAPQQDLFKPTKNIRNSRAKKAKLPSQPIYCDVCNCNLNSSSQAESHFKGQSHQKRMMKKVRDFDSSNASDPDLRIVEGYSSFEENGTSHTTGKLTEDDKKFCQHAGVTQPETTHPHNQNEFNSSEPPKKKQKVILAIPCEICGLTFNSEAQASGHFKSQKHNRKIQFLQQITTADPSPQVLSKTLRSNPPGKCRFHCSICNVSSNSSLQFDQHCSGQGHKKKLLNFSAPENEVAGNKSGWFYCRMCDVSCRTTLGLQKHVLSEEHKKTNAQTKADEDADSDAKYS